MNEQYFHEEVYGKVIDTPIQVCEIKCNGFFECETEEHEQLQIAYMQKGNAVFMVNRQRISLEAGQALMIRSGILHSQRPLEAKTCQYTIILMNYSFLYSEGMDMIRTHYILPIAKGRLQIPMLITEETPVGCKILQLMKEILAECGHNTAYGELKLRSIFYRLLYGLIECEESSRHVQKESAAQRIERAISYLHANPLAKTSVEELAVMACMSRESFYRHFRKEMDCTPIEYMTDLKLQQVMAMLEHSSLSVKVIAEEAGFSSANYLTRVFVKKKGVTPEQYRKKLEYQTDHQ